ncbi:hypothetical protein N0824_02918 [Microcystis sp. 0824]|nr:hypothetical protein N0824_02918 [Microcystis sp. 0824]
MKRRWESGVRSQESGVGCWGSGAVGLKFPYLPKSLSP